MRGGLSDGFGTAVAGSCGCCSVMGGVIGVSRGRSTSLGIVLGWEGLNVRWNREVFMSRGICVEGCEPAGWWAFSDMTMVHTSDVGGGPTLSVRVE